MNRALERIQRGYFFDYYRRLGRDAAREATRRWIAWLGAAGFVGVLTLVLLLAAGQGVTSALWGLVAFVAAWLLIVVWFVVTIPPRIESESRQTEDSLRAALQRKEQIQQEQSVRRGVGVQLKNHVVDCRVKARAAREAVIEGRTVEADTYHQVALMAVKDVAERLEWLGRQPGQMTYENWLHQVTDAVSSEKCATVEDAIAQLEALADVLEQQLADGIYT